MPTPTSNTIAVLVNIRSAENVGAIFRTADAAGVGELLLVGYTPAPIDRFNRARKDIAKAALGAEQTIPWQTFKTLRSVQTYLKKKNYTLVAIEQDERAVDYKKIKKSGDIAFVVGNEVTGLTKGELALVDVVAEIPMKGKKESLNVSVAFGIAVFRILGV